MKKVMLALCMVVGFMGCGGQDANESKQADKVSGAPVLPLVIPPVHIPPNLPSVVDCPSITTYAQINNDIGFFIDDGDDYTTVNNFFGGYTGMEIRLVGDLIYVNGTWTHDDHVVQIIGQEYDQRQPLATRYTGNCFDLTPSQWNISLGSTDAPDTTYAYNMYEGFSSGTGNRHYVRVDAYKYWPGTDLVEMSFITFDQGASWIQYITPTTEYFSVYAWNEPVNQ